MSSLSSQDPFSSLQVGSSMRVEWLHLGWFCTHILRSVVDTDQTKQLIGSLASEVQTLQLELHRAHRLLDKYADTVEVAERTGTIHGWITTLFTCIIAILGLLLGYSWVFRPRLRVQVPTKDVIGGSGGSNDSDSSSLDQHPLERRKDSLALRPARPSTLGRGRGRR